MATAVGLNMKITADTAGIGRGVAKTEQALSGLNKSAARAAGALRTLVGIEVGRVLAAGFSRAASSAIRYANAVRSSIDQTAKLAQRTGIAVEALQGFQVAADLSGVQNLEGALQKVSVVLGDAAAGSATATKALANIGLSVDEIMGMSPEDQFRAIAAGINAIPGAAGKAAAAVDLFGRSGVELLPLFASNLEEVEQRAQRLGIVLSGDQTAAVEEMNDALNLVSKTFSGIIGQVTANLAPVVTAMAEEFLSFVEAFQGFGGGGTGIADALTSGLLDFAEYMAGIFDSAIAQFGEFGTTMQSVAGVFEFVSNTFVAIGETLRFAFNIFEIAGNMLALGLGKFLEGLGSWVSSDLEQAGRDMGARAAEAMEQNTRQANAALSNAGSAASAAVFGGSASRLAGTGPATRAVQAGRERFADRNSPAAIAERESRQAAAAAERQQAAVAAAAKRAADEAQKAEEKRLAAIKKVDEEIAKVEEKRAERSLEIESDRLEALSQRSTQALEVSDIRSGGISEVLRIASGREDPAVAEYRKQLSELQKMRADLRALQSEKVQIIGAAA